jgi:hypothetical protein
MSNNDNIGIEIDPERIENKFNMDLIRETNEEMKNEEAKNLFFESKESLALYTETKQELYDVKKY